MKKYQELRINLTTDFTIWAIDCSVEEAKELAINNLKENIEAWLVMDIYDENTDKYIEEGKHIKEEA